MKINHRKPELGDRRFDLSKKAVNEIGLTTKEGTASAKIKVVRTPDGRKVHPIPSPASHSARKLY